MIFLEDPVVFHRHLSLFGGGGALLLPTTAEVAFSSVLVLPVF